MWGEGEEIKGGAEAGNPGGDLGGGREVSSHPQAAGDSLAGDGDTQLGRDETKGRFCSPRTERRTAGVA